MNPVAPVRAIVRDIELFQQALACLREDFELYGSLAKSRGKIQCLGLPQLCPVNPFQKILSCPGARQLPGGSSGQCVRRYQLDKTVDAQFFANQAMQPFHQAGTFHYI